MKYYIYLLSAMAMSVALLTLKIIGLTDSTTTECLIPLFIFGGVTLCLFISLVIMLPRIFRSLYDCKNEDEKNNGITLNNLSKKLQEMKNTLNNINLNKSEGEKE